MRIKGSIFDFTDTKNEFELFKFNLDYGAIPTSFYTYGLPGTKI
mgnify:CR=1 FL=1